ncbi:MAG TPA: YetF domain-containing protein [Gemmatimonadales bacterium]
MLNLAVPIWELILRSVVVYVFLVVLLRLSGKRQIGQMAPFDLVLLLVLSNAVQNSMNGGDNSLVGGLISAVTLVTLNFGLGVLTYRNKRLEALVEGKPEVLIHNGKLYEQGLKGGTVTHHELTAALRKAGCAGVEDVHYAVLENDGSISVVQKK